MALNPIRPRLRNISNDLAKITLSIPAGDEIEVSEDVAAQIAHQQAPLAVAAPEKAPVAPEAPAEAEDAPEAKKPAKRTRKATA